MAEGFADYLTLSGPCRELTFPSFLFFANKRLVNHTRKTVQVGNMGECERFCYEEYNCVSINFERKRNGDGKYHYELNNSTHGEHDQDLVDTENYLYRGTKVALSKENAELSTVRVKGGMSLRNGIIYAEYDVWGMTS